MKDFKLKKIIMFAIAILWTFILLSELPFTLKQCKSILEGDDIQAKNNLLESILKAGKEQPLQKILSQDLQRYIVERFIRDYDALHEKNVKNLTTDILSPFSQSIRQQANKEEKCLIHEEHLVRHLYQPRYVDDLIVRLPWTVSVKIYKKVAVMAMVKHGKKLIRDPKRAGPFSCMIRDAALLSKRGELDLSSEEKRFFAELVTDKLKDLVGQANPCRFHSNPKSHIRASRALDLSGSDVYALTIIKKCIEAEHLKTGKIINLIFLVNEKIHGAEQLLLSQAKEEKDPVLKGYLNDLLQAYKKGERAPVLSKEVKKRLGLHERF